MTWTDVYTSVKRQGVCAAMVLSIGLFLTVLVILFSPRRYQSEAKLLIKLGRENVSLDPTVASAGETASVLRTNESEVTTALQMMLSESVLEQVIESVGEKAILKGTLESGGSSGGLIKSIKKRIGGIIASIDPIDDSERALMELQDGLKIQAESESNVVNVWYRAKSPELAHLVTQTWVDTYKKDHARMNSIGGSLDFFRTQEKLLEKELQAARERLKTMKSDFGIVTVVGRQANLESQLQWAQSSLIQNRARLAGARGRFSSLSRLREGTAEKIVTSEMKADTNETASSMRDRLFQLEIEQSRLAAKYTPNHPEYLAIEQQVRNARQLVASQSEQSQQVTQGINPMFTTVMENLSVSLSVIDGIESEVNATEEIIKKLRLELDELNAQEAKLAVVEREVGALEAEYLVHHERREQARLSEELKTSGISNINVIQPATLRQRPVSPNKKRCALLGLLGSLASAMGLAFLRESKYQANQRTGQSPSNLVDDGETPSLDQRDHAELPVREHDFGEPETPINPGETTSTHQPNMPR